MHHNTYLEIDMVIYMIKQNTQAMNQAWKLIYEQTT